MTEIWEVGKLLAVTADFFTKRGIESARLDAELLLAHTLDISRESLLARRERRLTDIELSAFRERVRHRAGDKPVAYLLNRKEFFSLNFYVDENVLIPRPETEHLVELALKSVGSKSNIRICDVGTGSGCVAAAIAHSLPEARVIATEFSRAAAAVAVHNMAELGLLGRARVVLCDLFPIQPADPYDVIVSNPPYLSVEEFESLPPTIRRFEPRMALTDEEEGVNFHRRILRAALTRLKPDGVIFVEISPRLAGRFQSEGGIVASPFICAAIHPDLAALPRVAEIRFRSN